MTTFNGHYYNVTDEAITPTGKIETYEAAARDEAIAKALYTHRLHNGNAAATEHGVIHCPSCGQIAIVEAQAEEEQAHEFPRVWTPEGMQYTFDGTPDDPIQPNLF